MTAAILFDFNGVIIDDEPQHCDALIATLAEYGYDLDRNAYYAEYLGFDDRECFRFSFVDGAWQGQGDRRGDREEDVALLDRALAQFDALVPGAPATSTQGRRH